MSEPRDLNIQKALEVQQEIEALDSFISKLYNDLKNKQKDFEKTNTELEEEHQKVSKINNQNLTEIQLICKDLDWVSTNETCNKSNTTLIAIIEDCIRSIPKSIGDLKILFTSLLSIGISESLNTGYGSKVNEMTSFLEEISITLTEIVNRSTTRNKDETYLYNLRDMIYRKCKGGTKSLYSSKESLSFYTNTDHKPVKNKVVISGQVVMSEKIRSIICR